MVGLDPATATIAELKTFQNKQKWVAVSSAKSLKKGFTGINKPLFPTASSSYVFLHS